MKFCKKCGTLYANDLVTCPKCNSAVIDHVETPQEPAPKEVVRKQWISILIGIPAFILFIYLIIFLYARFMGALRP